MGITKQALINYLRQLIGNAKTELNYSNNFELLVAVILSAQCTDKRVNLVTDKLFKKYLSINDYANADINELSNDIKSTNYYITKARHIKEMAYIVKNKFNGIVPNSLDDLLTLPGVGRKTANVILAVAFNKSVFPVDTHVNRVCNRLGLVNCSKPIDCEKKISEDFAEFDLGELHHLILLFGRYYCKAINPECKTCKLIDICKYHKEK